MTSGGGSVDPGVWVERYARLGYLVKGIVYLTVGLLALQLAIGVGGRTAGASSALLIIARQPFGRTLLTVVAVGLVGYALWRLVQALLDVEGKGTSPRGLLKRVGYLASGLAYGGLALEAWRLLLGIGSSSDGGSQELWTARFLAAPFGNVLVAAGALVMFALAVNAGVVAFGRLYREKLDLPRMSDTEMLGADVLGIVGLLGRGAVFAVIGGFLAVAAWRSDPQAAGSSEEALDAIAGGPYGAWVLAGVAVGLVAYGAFAIVQARYRRMDV